MNLDPQSPSSGPMSAVNYRAPFLITKLLKERIVDDAAEAEELFREAIRYMILGVLFPNRTFQMYSRRVDEVWHQFILFTKEYTAFCTRYFGRYLHHLPGDAPDYPTTTTISPADAYREFVEYYQRAFGQPPPRAWSDKSSITLSRRMLLRGHLTLRRQGDMIEVQVDSVPALSVTAIAEDALLFIAHTHAFYVRELPALEDEEKLDLAEALLSRNVLLIGN